KKEEKKEETELPDGDVPLASAPDPSEAEELIELPEEDVPLSSIPFTGTVTVPFMGFSLLSAIGLFLTGRRRKDEE
ncbi:MAG: LPXTG cell wall anchor domain-containing protein, partial [Firmicutes bacterium]|nr:LPXTG cell wall anchor domain-containing protein [Bacillota bacterium]